MADTNIRFNFLAQARDFLNKNRQVQSSMTRTERGFSMAKRAVGAFGLAIAGSEVIRWAGDAIQLASAAEEVDSKFQAVFGTARDLEGRLEAWGDVAGVTTTKAKDLAATFGNLATAQGISREATEDLTVDVAELAGDLASFNDADPAQVFFNLNKALLTTEREGMKQYGIAITEAEVKTRAAAIAAAEGRSEVTKADRAYASYAIAVEQAGKAVGDLERTSDSAANQQRQLRASMEELQEEIGKELLPVYVDLLGVVEDLGPAIKVTARIAAESVGNLKNLTGAVDSATDSSKSLAARFGDVSSGLTRWATQVPGYGALAEGFAQRLDRIGEAARQSGGGVRTHASAARELTEVPLPTWLQDVIDKELELSEVQAGTVEMLNTRYGDTEYEAYLRRVNQLLKEHLGVNQRIIDAYNNAPDAPAWITSGIFDATKAADAETVRRRVNGLPGLD